MKNVLPSKKQHALLQFIDGFIREHDYAPSYREVARALDYKSVSTVATHINGLIERGWLIKRDNEKRSVEVVYKAGQTDGDTSPAPSLAGPHEAWLRNIVSEKLVIKTSDDDRETIRRALDILGLPNIMPAASEAREGQRLPGHHDPPV